MAIVIGKGPNLEGRNLGSWIDSFNTIIRLSGGITDDDYGHECDYLLTTTAQYRLIKEHELEGVKQLWIYKTRGKIRGECPVPMVRLNAEVMSWVKWYGKHYDKSGLDTSRTWYPSKGTVAVIAVMCMLNDDVIVAGFDSVFLDMPDNKRVTHDWLCEKMLLRKLAREKGRKLLVLQ